MPRKGSLKLVWKYLGAHSGQHGGPTPAFPPRWQELLRARRPDKRDGPPPSALSYLARVCRTPCFGNSISPCVSHARLLVPVGLVHPCMPPLALHTQHKYRHKLATPHLTHPDAPLPAPDVRVRPRTPPAHRGALAHRLQVDGPTALSVRMMPACGHNLRSAASISMGDPPAVTWDLARKVAVDLQVRDRVLCSDFSTVPDRG